MPRGNVAETRTFSFSLAVAIGLATSPESAITKLVIRIVTKTEIFRTLYSTYS